MGDSEASEAKAQMARQVFLSYGYMFMWITLSSCVIMVNKYILDPQLGGFPYPLTLTASHMAFCSALSWVLIKAGYVEAQPIKMDVYMSAVVPVGALFAITLWLGNAAYLYLSVSFIQMLKATMPILVYFTACMFGVEAAKASTALNMVVVVTGIVIASYGELRFVVVGVMLQCSSLVSEAVRLTLVQVLLQRKGVKLNPITTMYYVSPVCLAFLVVPLLVVEVKPLLAGGANFQALPMAASIVSAFALNISVYLLIGKTSALTMNVAGVVKDWLLIGLSVALYGSPVTRTQLFGYSIALAGVFYYNYQKVKAMQPHSPSQGGGGGDKGGDRESGGGAKESQPLLSRGGTAGDKGDNRD